MAALKRRLRPRLGMERCGKRNASNSGSEIWTGIGVVAGFGAVVLLMPWPHRRNREVPWRSELLQILQKVRGNGKTRNQLSEKDEEKFLPTCVHSHVAKSTPDDTGGPSWRITPLTSETVA